MLAGGDPRLNYSLGELLGEGSYGSVFSAFPSFETKHHYDVFAVKIIPISIDGNTTEIEKEIAFLRSLKSPYIVSFVESFLIGGELWIIMECCGGGSLADINQVTKLDESAIKAILAFSILGLDFLHKTKKVIHRDIKPGNILLTLDGKAKLSDFGVSAQLSSTLMRRKTVIGSPYWMAPDDGKADIWSLGITLLELCEGKPPHYDISPLRAIFMISSRPAPQLKQPDDWSAELVDFLGRCLVKNSEKRASSRELLDHPFIAKEVDVVERSCSPRRSSVTASPVPISSTSVVGPSSSYSPSFGVNAASPSTMATPTTIGSDRTSETTCLGLPAIKRAVDDNLGAILEMKRKASEARKMLENDFGLTMSSTIGAGAGAGGAGGSAATLRFSASRPLLCTPDAMSSTISRGATPSLDDTPTSRALGSSIGTRLMGSLARHQRERNNNGGGGAGRDQGRVRGSGGMDGNMGTLASSMEDDEDDGGFDDDDNDSDSGSVVRRSVRESFSASVARVPSKYSQAYNRLDASSSSSSVNIAGRTRREAAGGYDDIDHDATLRQSNQSISSSVVRTKQHGSTIHYGNDAITGGRYAVSGHVAAATGAGRGSTSIKSDHRGVESHATASVGSSRTGDGRRVNNKESLKAAKANISAALKYFDSDTDDDDDDHKENEEDQRANLGEEQQRGGASGRHQTGMRDSGTRRPASWDAEASPEISALSLSVSNVTTTTAAAANSGGTLNNMAGARDTPISSRRTSTDASVLVPTTSTPAPATSRELSSTSVLLASSTSSSSSRAAASVAANSGTTTISKIKAPFFMTAIETMKQFDPNDLARQSQSKIDNNNGSSNKSKNKDINNGSTSTSTSTSSSSGSGGGAGRGRGMMSSSSSSSITRSSDRPATINKPLFGKSPSESSAAKSTTLTSGAQSKADFTGRGNSYSADNSGAKQASSGSSRSSSNNVNMGASLSAGGTSTVEQTSTPANRRRGSGEVENEEEEEDGGAYDSDDSDAFLLAEEIQRDLEALERQYRADLLELELGYQNRRTSLLSQLPESYTRSGGRCNGEATTVGAENVVSSTSKEGGVRGNVRANTVEAKEVQIVDRKNHSKNNTGTTIPYSRNVHK